MKNKLETGVGCFAVLWITMCVIVIPVFVIWAIVKTMQHYGII